MNLISKRIYQLVYYVNQLHSFFSCSHSAKIYQSVKKHSKINYFRLRRFAPFLWLRVYLLKSQFPRHYNIFSTHVLSLFSRWFPSSCCYHRNGNARQLILENVKLVGCGLEWQEYLTLMCLGTVKATHWALWPRGSGHYPFNLLDINLWGNFEKAQLSRNPFGHFITKLL